MNELKIFENEEFGEIRTVEVDEKPYFFATDIAKALGYANPHDAISKHCRWVAKREVPHPQSNTKTIEVNVIPEGDLYRLISNSELPNAQKFESWIFDEVLPSIRKHGGYLAGQEEMSNEELLSKALLFAQKKIEDRDRIISEKQKRIEEMKPKEIFADAVTASSTSILIRDLAKILKQNGVHTGEKRLYKWMRENGYIIKNSNRPTQKAMELGLFEIIESTIQRTDLPPITTMTTKVTGKGQQYFINKFLYKKISR